VQRIKAIAFERRWFGCRRLNQLLLREGFHVNHKKIYRLYREAGLAVRKRKRRKGLMIERQPLFQPDRPNHTRSMHFVMVLLANGRRIKYLTIVDDFSKECLDIKVGHGIYGKKVTRTLDIISAFRDYPVALRTDLGPRIYWQGTGSIGISTGC